MALHDHHANSVEKLKAMNEEMALALAEIDKIKIDTKDNALKRARVKAIRDHFLRLQKQAYNLTKITKNMQIALDDLGTGQKLSTSQFADKLKTIASDFDAKLTLTHKTSLDLVEMANARLHRQVTLRDEDGKQTGERAAAAEDYRRLKLGIDMLFVPETSQTLGITQPKDKEHNGESYFCKIVEHGLKNCFDEEGNFIESARRGPKYGEDLGEYITKLYALNRAEDALYAIKLLKMAEGKENQQMFPSGFKDFVLRHMCTHYGKDQQAIMKDPHAKLFIERAHELASQDDHSPLPYGPRDTAKTYFNRVRNYIYGRMYPSSDSFIAVPLHMSLVQEPLIKRRSAIVAYLTGGQLDPIAEAGRPPRKGNALEDQIGLYINRTWWWRKKEESETKEGEDPKRKNIVIRVHDFYKRSPFWVKTPMRAAQLIAIATAALFIASGAALPMATMIPLYSLAAASSVNYGLKAARGLWRIPFINQGVKKTAKWTAIAAITAASAYVIVPLLPAAGAMLMTAAIAHPTAAAVIAAPFALVATIAAGNGIAHLVGKGKGSGNRKVSFGDFRAENKIETPTEVEDIIAAQPTIKEPAVVVLEITPDVDMDDDKGEAQQQANQPAFDAQAFATAFADEMAKRDAASMKEKHAYNEAFMAEMYKMADRDEELMKKWKKCLNA